VVQLWTNPDSDAIIVGDDGAPIDCPGCPCEATTCCAAPGCCIDISSFVNSLGSGGGLCDCGNPFLGIQSIGVGSYCLTSDNESPCVWTSSCQVIGSDDVTVVGILTYTYTQYSFDSQAQLVIAFASESSLTGFVVTYIGYPPEDDCCDGREMAFFSEVPAGQAAINFGTTWPSSTTIYPVGGSCPYSSAEVWYNPAPDVLVALTLVSYGEWTGTYGGHAIAFYGYGNAFATIGSCTYGGSDPSVCWGYITLSANSPFCLPTSATFLVEIL
jgi:hypothetical protein